MSEGDRHPVRTADVRAVRKTGKMQAKFQTQQWTVKEERRGVLQRPREWEGGSKYGSGFQGFLEGCWRSLCLGRRQVKVKMPRRSGKQRGGGKGRGLGGGRRSQRLSRHPCSSHLHQGAFFFQLNPFPCAPSKCFSQHIC